MRAQTFIGVVSGAKAECARRRARRVWLADRQTSAKSRDALANSENAVARGCGEAGGVAAAVVFDRQRDAPVARRRRSTRR